MLWTSSPDEPHDPQIILEQYKIYAEMADRVSARRGAANTFFLTLNTSIVALMATVWVDHPSAGWLYLPAFIALEVQCLAWFWLVRSYRQLNAAKYVVIAAFEEKLPASPYWSAEWIALGEGKDPSRYWPLTHIEQWIPATFAITYLAVFALAL
ncbi:hypothetical protein ACF1HJ_32925 [Streptomyces sp. NPDC013978]|uniref:RipA family octameric membrane protein n=1 Tax=Streptomyces sp. NPDC013978 TaxID=3364869 RepID=UPI0036F6B3BE